MNITNTCSIDENSTPQQRLAFCRERERLFFIDMATLMASVDNRNGPQEERDVNEIRYIASRITFWDNEARSWEEVIAR